MLDVVKQVFPFIVSLGLGIYNALVMPISEFLTNYQSSFSNFLLDLLDFVGLDDFIANYSFGSLFLGIGAISILVIWFIKLFI